MIHIQKAVVGAFEVNCYVVWGPEPHALVVDPGADPELIREVLSRNELDVAAYLLTHGHIDHISALENLYETNPAPIAIHPADASWAFAATNLFPPFYEAIHKPAEIERTLADDQPWTDSGLDYRVITTPGHTPGSVCFYFEKARTLICGDTLFQGSVGRTDLPGGSPRELTRSLRKLAVLPDDTAVYAGHGPETTIADEKRRNYFMQSAAREAQSVSHHG
jgi:hydroxyacylglutathione hydrolase